MVAKAEKHGVLSALGFGQSQPVPEDKNGMTRKVHKHALETIECLSVRQLEAGLELSRRYEAQFKGPPAIKEVQVDSSSKPDAHVDIMISVTSRYLELKGAVPSDMRPVVEHVCEQGHSIRQGLGNWRNEGMHMANLQVALDLVANKMRLN